MKPSEVETFETSVGRIAKTKYGLHQKVYPMMAAESCKEVITLIENTSKDTKSYEILFFTLLNMLGEHRGEIAAKMDTNASYFFGLRRDRMRVELPIYTALKYEYNLTGRNLNARALDVLENYGGEREDANSKITVQKKSWNEIKEEGYLKSDQSFFNSLYLEKVSEYKSDKEFVSKDVFSKSLDIDALMNEPAGTFYTYYKEKEVQFASKIHDQECWKNLINFAFNSLLKSHLEEIILGDIQYNFSGKFYASTRFLIGKGKLAVLQTPVIMHMSPCFLPMAVKELSNIFGKALLEKDDKKFLEHMAHFEYLFSLAAVYVRGSASIREILTKAIFKWRRYTLVPYKEDQTIDQIVYQTFLLSDFIKIYPECFQESPLKSA